MECKVHFRQFTCFCENTHRQPLPLRQQAFGANLQIFSKISSMPQLLRVSALFHAVYSLINDYMKMASFNNLNADLIFN